MWNCIYFTKISSSVQNICSKLLTRRKNILNILKFAMIRNVEKLCPGRLSLKLSHYHKSHCKPHATCRFYDSVAASTQKSYLLEKRNHLPKILPLPHTPLARTSSQVPYNSRNKLRKTQLLLLYNNYKQILCKRFNS